MRTRNTTKSLFPLLLLASLLLAGCGKDWINPNIADPYKEDQIFEEDSKQCENLAVKHYPQDNQLGGQTGPEYEDSIQRDEFDYTEHKEAYSAWEQCMRQRGWITKKEFYGE